MFKILKNPCRAVVFPLAAILPATTLAEDSEEEQLAKQLSNPVASLISVPFQFNYDRGIGPTGDGERVSLNIQPVIPISLSPDWNLISRTIIPIVHQSNIVPGGGNQSGLSDIVQSFFLSPSEPGPGGLIWGAGPVFLFPTATDPLLGTGKWGAGPTGVVLKQSGPWTYGALANHIWSFAGDSSRADISATFVQPFVSYTTDDAVTFALNTETTYDWNNDQWSVPINMTVSKLVEVGDQPINLTLGLRYWAVSAPNGPEGFGGRASIVFLFPASGY